MTRYTYLVTLDCGPGKDANALLGYLASIASVEGVPMEYDLVGEVQTDSPPFTPAPLEDNQ